MSNHHFWLTEAQFARLKPPKPLLPNKTHGLPRIDDRHLISSIIRLIRSDLTWPAAPTGYGPHKRLYNRVVRWSRAEAFDPPSLPLWQPRAPRPGRR
ncbi:MAG: transposase [Truepera sp.]|nr:transposase [Truepera sp.]